MERLTALDQLIARMPARPDRCWIVTGGIRTHYLTLGSGDPLVLVHGGGAGAVQWHRVLSILSKSFRVIAPDVVGYGESDKPQAPYDRDYFARWLDDFTGALGLRRFHVVGVSQSGPASLQFTVDHQDKVDRLVLVDSAGFQTRVPLGALLGMMWLYSLPSRSALRWYGRYVVHNPESLDDLLTAYAIGVIKMTGGKRAFWRGKGRAVEPIPGSLVGRATRPLQIIWGREDRLFALNGVQRIIRSLPHARLEVLPGAGHLSFLDQPLTFCETLTRFLE